MKQNIVNEIDFKGKVVFFLLPRLRLKEKIALTEVLFLRIGRFHCHSFQCYEKQQTNFDGLTFERTEFALFFLGRGWIVSASWTGRE